MKTYQERANELIQLGNSAHSNGRVDEAIRAYRSAIDLVPAYGSLHLLIADLLFEAGLREEAEAEYRESVAFEPEHDQAWAGLGRCQLLNNDLDGAAISIQTALAANPHNPEASYYGALLSARNGDSRAALDRLLSALDARPEWEAQAREEALLAPLFESSRRLKNLAATKRWWEFWK